MDRHKVKELGSSRIDLGVALAKGVAGAVPLVGSTLAEAISVTIPRQRLDRVIEFIEALEQRLSEVEKAVIHENKYFLDLLEDGVVQSSRTVSPEKRDHLVSFLAKAAEVERGEYEAKKKLLRILEELTEKDLAILRGIHAKGYQRTARDHPVPTLARGPYQELSETERYEYDLAQVSWGLHIATLERHGLLVAEREEPDQDGTSRHLDPETGLPRIRSYRVSDLGEVLLASLA